MTRKQERLQQAFGSREPAYGSRREVAAYLGLPVATLDGWAYRGIGPGFVKIGRHTRYRWSDVETWIAAQQRGGSGKGAA